MSVTGSSDSGYVNQKEDGWLLRQFITENDAGANSSTPQASTDASSTMPAVEEFTPLAPKAFSNTGLEDHQLESLILKYLFNRGVASGEAIARQVRLSFPMIAEFLREMKTAQLIGHRKSSGALGDFEFQLTNQGLEHAKRYAAQSSYFGSAPVPFDDYVASVNAQSVNHERITPARLSAALADLSINETMLSRLGQAMTAGRRCSCMARRVTARHASPND